MSGEIKPSNSESAMATSSSSSQKNVSDVGSFSNPPPSTTWSPKELTPSQKLLKKSKETPYVPIGELTTGWAVFTFYKVSFDNSISRASGACSCVRRGH